MAIITNYRSIGRSFKKPLQLTTRLSAIKAED
jgi:hypothetical protein